MDLRIQEFRLDQMNRPSRQLQNRFTIHFMRFRPSQQQSFQDSLQALHRDFPTTFFERSKNLVFEIRVFVEWFRDRAEELE